MNGTNRTVGAIIMVMILLISIIYLAFSIDTIRSSQAYGDIFRPNQGLSIFNIIISVFGIALAIFCLFIVSGARAAFCRIAVIGCMIFALFAFGSLIAALAINYAAIDRVSSRFVNYMDQYASNADARNIISTVQIHYDCCGNNVWKDWAEVPSHTTTSTTTKSTRKTKAPLASTTVGLDTSTSKPIVDIGEISSSTGNDLIIDYDGSTATTATKATRTKQPTKTTTTTDAWNIDSDTDVDETTTSGWDLDSFLGGESIEATTDSYWDLDSLQNLGLHNVEKRAAHPKRDIDLYGDSSSDLGLSTTTVLPGSCCLNRSSKPSDSIATYCISIHSSPNNVRQEGCSKKIAKGAIGHTFATAVINSLLIILALLSIPLLNRIYPVAIYHQKIYRKPSLQNHQGADAYGGPTVIDGKPRDSVVNSHADYSVYQNNAYVQNK